jgi:hypothetical protein
MPHGNGSQDNHPALIRIFPHNRLHLFYFPKRIHAYDIEKFYHASDNMLFGTFRAFEVNAVTRVESSIL